jgi:hypothetical protein
MFTTKHMQIVYLTFFHELFCSTACALQDLQMKSAQQPGVLDTIAVAHCMQLPHRKGSQ